jgi:hypothetical protein
MLLVWTAVAFWLFGWVGVLIWWALWLVGNVFRLFVADDLKRGRSDQ